MPSILEQECREKGENRYGEKMLTSGSGNSKVFYDAQARTGRLGSGWAQAGVTFQGPSFLIEDGGKKWQVKISGDSYTATEVQK